MQIKVAPSILAANQLKLEDEIGRLNVSNADLIHIDIMDGVYVPNISLGFSIVKEIKNITKIPLDVHMMTIHPEKYVERLVEFGASYITIHHDSSDYTEVVETLKHIRKRGVKAGIAISPKIDGKEAIKLLDYVDLVLVMTVEPGYGGQKFQDMSDKIRIIKDEINNRELDVDIEVDGGINEISSKICIDSGASILVAGTYVFASDDMENAILTLKQKKLQI